jgi:S-DNA-T family DNA segregation ATPase FtsK/SpoIIIE
MADKKSTQAPPKTIGKAKKTGAPAAPASKKNGPKTAAQKSSGKKTAGQKPGPGSATKVAPPKQPMPPRASSRASHPARPIRQGISLDRKLDIVGISLALVGILTLLSFLSATNGSLTGVWVTNLAKLFGRGMYIFPIGLLLIGLWLLLRNFERIPQLAVERLAGFALVYICFLAGVHFLEMYLIGQDPMSLAQAGGGGGYIGALIAGMLEAVLGVGGAAIALAALALVALALSFDVTIMEMAHWVQEQYMRLLDWAGDKVDEFQSRGKQGSPGMAKSAGGIDQPSALPEYHPTGILPVTPATGQAGLPTTTIGRTAASQAQTPVWVLPPAKQILDEGGEVNYDDEIDLQRARLIEETLSSFGAPAKVIEINRGPTITQFGVEPDFVESRGGRMRVRVGKITALADDLALALSARTIRVQAPVPGKGFVGIEVPNEEIALVALGDLIESEAFKRLKSPLRFALGLNVSGNAVSADMAAMPHLLIAGATGSGKSVCVNSLICCLLLHNTPDDLRLVMVDPKRVELTGYNGIPHLMAPVVVELERVITVLQWVTREMDMRYRKLAEAGCRNIQEYNTKAAGRGQTKLPFLVVIIDELADLMMLAPDETERTITRLAQLARATGIHLVIATQRPSVDVVTGLIKANFPARVAFAVASGVDSRVILDQPGAERLLGRGDMLFQAPDAPAPVRLQGVFVSEGEIQRLVSYWQAFAGLGQPAPTAAGGIVDAPPASVPLKQMPLWEEMMEEEAEDADPMLREAIELSRRQGRASISMLQRRLRIGYTRAARIIETMETRGIVGPPEPGTGTRQILDYGAAAPPLDDN